MTDTATDATGDLVTLWNAMLAEINELDREIDSWNPALGVKRQFVGELKTKAEPIYKESVDNLIAQLREMSDEDRVGAFLGFRDALNKEFSKEVEDWVAKQVEELPKPEKVEVSDEHRKEVTEKRSERYTMAKQLHQLATGFNLPGVDKWELPKVRRGGGKRGKRALNQYTWFIDGVEVDADKQSPKFVAELLGYDKQADFTKALKSHVVGTTDKGEPIYLNTTKPPSEFELTLRGKLVSAVRNEAAEDEDEDMDDEGDEDDES